MVLLICGSFHVKTSAQERGALGWISCEGIPAACSSAILLKVTSPLFAREGSSSDSFTQVSSYVFSPCASDGHSAFQLCFRAIQRFAPVSNLCGIVDVDADVVLWVGDMFVVTHFLKLLVVAQRHALDMGGRSYKSRLMI
ncbi:hypothetical protein AL065_09845 [Pseudomonas amygdali pv. ulmi]|nr:hypothetical protein AL065_09845 [Pseudomonas amygdali pv. ulmi]